MIDPASAAQVIKQMNKLINVLQATDMTESPAVSREMVLLRVRTSTRNRTAVLKEAEIFGARVVDSSTEGFALEATGRLRKARRVHRRHAQLRRNRSDPFGRRGRIARSQETTPVSRPFSKARRAPRADQPLDLTRNPK